MKPTSVKEIARLLQLPFPERDAIVKGAAVDTRLMKDGDLFFALPGANTDGHTFLAEAASKGASGAIIHEDYKGQDFGLPLLRCNDVLKALQNLAKDMLALSKAQIVAVTGSLGKTTTKEFIASLLRIKYRVYASQGNSNSQIGLPLSILNNMTLDEEILVIEMGMTDRGQIERLIEIAPPTVALVTMVALVHAGNFDSIEGIAQSKSEIFLHPSTKLGIFHLESDYGAALSRRGTCRKLSFSTTSSQADIHLKLGNNEMAIKEALGGSVALPVLELPGEHNRHNFLATVAVARYFGMDWKEIIEGQSFLKLPERRMEMIEKFGALFVNDSYNASELSMKAALNSLPEPKPGCKRIAVLGSMVELGKFSETCHRTVGEHALKCVDSMFCFGDDCRVIQECWQAAGKPVVWAKERSGIIDALRSQLKPGDVVLLKGSRLRGVWKVLDEL